MVEYKDHPAIKDLFVMNPYITQHMSAKDRNDYHQFRKGKVEKKQGQLGPMIPPPPSMNFPIMGPPPSQQPSFMMMNRQNYGPPPPNQYYQPMWYYRYS